MAIERLADLVISQIAAGEVVERPASVIKELIENALDAEATTITVEVNNGGKTLIRVSDNGTGILHEEMPLAVARHATSKLRTAEDLFAIQTLGFRGEALASIVSVSYFTLASRHRSESVGTELRLAGGELLSERESSLPSGTVITVENLFYNTPARLKFLKAESTEKRHILALVTEYAMAYPQVRFTLIQDGRESFRTIGNGRLSDVVVKAFGLDVFKQMIEVFGEEVLRLMGDSIQLRGMVSLPGMMRSDRSKIVLFVNGRVIQDSGLVYALTQAYHLLIEKGQFPYAVLMVSVPPEFVDVNVHPTKAEVRFQEPNLVFSIIQRTIRQALMHHTHPNSVQEADSHALVESITPSMQQQPLGFQVPAYPSTSSRRLIEAREMSDEELKAIPEGMGRPAKPRTLPILRVVGQIAGLYIVAEAPAGLYLFDQNACHERVLFEEISEIMARDNALSTQTVDGATIELRQAQMRLIESFQSALLRYGISVEPFGNTTLLVRQIPSFVAPRDAVMLVQRVVLALEQGGDFDEIVRLSVSQTGAVKSGQPLTLEEMQHIIRQLERCPSPFASPSGKPTLLHLSAENLAQAFQKRL